MRNTLLLLLSLLLAANAFATPEEEVRAAELAFSKAFVARDADRFFAMVAEDAVFNGRGPSLHGRKAIVEGWGPLLTSPKPAMTWGPDRVVVNGDGTIGLSFGPIYDYETRRNVGYYSSIWQKQKDGSWKVLFDGPGAAPAALAENALKAEEGFITTEDGARLHYRKVGEGRPTLIVPQEQLLFDPFTQFADSATVIAYEPRSGGKRDVQDLEAVRTYFKLEKFVPVGYASASKTVAEYAMQYPQHVSRLVLLSPAAMDATWNAEDVQKVMMPVLTIHGSKEAGFAAAEAWRKALPNARLMRVDGAGQQAWVDDPVVVFGTIRQFLRGEVPLASM
jgi:ketosteroid isomerase-like protein